MLSRRGNVEVARARLKLASDGDVAVSEYAEFHASLPVRRPRRLVLVNPPQVPKELFSLEIARLKGYYAFQPVGLLYIAAVAKAAMPDLEVSVLDLNFELLRRCHEPDFDYSFW